MAFKYSVLLSVYQNDNPAWFELAVDSMLLQTISPEEIVVVEDGPVSREIDIVIEKRAEQHPGLFRIIKLPQNRGLGEALRIGVCECRNEWIARMDADDYSAPERIAKQMAAILRMNADIVGCDVAEFIGVPDENHRTAFRVFPEYHEEIMKFGRRRTPFAHPAVLMKRSCIINAGNYQKAYLHEDYDLFARMLQGGCIAYTVKEPLVFMRVNKDFYKRRGGWKYLCALLDFNWKQLKTGWMKPTDFLVRSACNIVFCIMPNRLRDFMYRRMLRR